MSRRKNDRRRTAAHLVGVAVFGLMLAACDSLLDVSLPGQTPADALAGPESAALLVTSTQGDFECAFSNYTLLTGIVAGEIMGAQSSLAMIPYQRRNVRPIDTSFGEGGCDGDSGLYTPLSTARFTADEAFNRISSFSDADVSGRTRLLGRAALYAGFSYTVFAEGFCSAAFDSGPEVLPNGIFQLAKDRFTKAIDLAGQAGDSETRNAAYVGRARVELQLGETAPALADAKQVPAGFLKTVTRSSAATGRVNDVYAEVNRDRAQSIDTKFWNQTWMDVPDPRVSVTVTGQKGIDGLTDLAIQHKYPGEGSAIRLASGVEAQLIIAELEGGQTAVGIINQLHAAAGIPGFTSSDPNAIRAQVIEERRREFFLEGRRMGDLRHYGGFDEAAGGRHPYNGDQYGGTQCFPIPDIERNLNPNLSGG